MSFLTLDAPTQQKHVKILLFKKPELLSPVYYFCGSYIDKLAEWNTIDL